MTERRDRIASFATGPESVESGRSRAATAAFVAGMAVVAATSALYFFGTGAFSRPAVSVSGLALGLALLAPLARRER